MHPTVVAALAVFAVLELALVLEVGRQLKNRRQATGSESLEMLSLPTHKWPDRDMFRLLSREGTNDYNRYPDWSEGEDWRVERDVLQQTFEKIRLAPKDTTKRTAVGSNSLLN